MTAPKLFLRHHCDHPTLSYYTSPYLYFNEEEIEAWDFMTQTLEKNEFGKNKAGSYIVPIHKKKTVESGFTEHIYYHEMKPLRKWQIIHNGERRFYCKSCKKMARIIKNEDIRPMESKECKSCLHNKR
jgi:hypothetical protein